MKETQVTIPELMLIAGTRAAIGGGLGLLLADRLSPEKRKAVGWTLLTFGALSTIPLALEIFGQRRSADGARTEQIADERQRQSPKPAESEFVSPQI